MAHPETVALTASETHQQKPRWVAIMPHREQLEKK